MTINHMKSRPREYYFLIQEQETPNTRAEANLFIQSDKNHNEKQGKKECIIKKRVSCNMRLKITNPILSKYTVNNINSVHGD